jgi:diguanylate cyclase (GGDEF)-like protein
LAFLAYHDERTGMLNKQAFVRDMDGLLKRGRGMAFLCALDGFGDVVDSFGFAFSDRLLRLVGERVMQIAEEHGPDAGSAYHLEGDQFAILLSTPQTAESLDRFERRLMETMSEPFVADDQTVFLSASAGQYTLFGQESDAEDVLRRLKRALAEAQEHHNTVSRYSPEVHVAVASTQQLVQKLRRATHEHEFRVHYQPIIDRTGRVAAAEALLRWEPAGPEQFIVLAEQSGLIVPITEELVSIVCGDIPRMRAVSPDLKTYINISARHIGQLHLVKLLTDRLSGCTVDSGMLGVEITETSFFKEDQAVLRVMRELTGEGFSVAIDDFGTGYSSLSYLKRLPADRIKIDRSFVTDLPGSQADGALVESVISLGHRLGKKVVAEGVETEAQYQYLFRRGVDFFQGFHFASASPVDAFSVSLADSMQLGT